LVHAVAVPALLTRPTQVEAQLERIRGRESDDAFALALLHERPLRGVDTPAPLQHVRLLKEVGRGQVLRPLPKGTLVPPDLFRHSVSARASPPPVWSDSLCAKLAQEERANVVLCSGAFECFTCALDEQEWDVPILVRSGAAGQRVAYAGKPLLPARMSLRAKNSLFYKARIVPAAPISSLKRAGSAQHVR